MKRGGSLGAVSIKRTGGHEDMRVDSEQGWNTTYQGESNSRYKNSD